METLDDVAEDLEGEVALDRHGVVVDQVVQRAVLLQSEGARERGTGGRGVGVGVWGRSGRV